jgi:hypothetical protein
MARKNRPNPSRRARAWAAKHNTPDPTYVACPVCLANPREACRAIREAFHPERVANANFGRASLRQIGAGLPR